MDKSQRLRWGILLSTLAATLGAIAYPKTEPDIPARPRPAFPHAAPDARLDTVSPEREIDWVATDENPFTSRGWVSPPTESATAVIPVVMPTQAPVVPPPPVLPFKFIGQMVDGADQVIYLGIGEQVMLARLGEILDGTYKVVAITPTQVEFEFIASGVRQALPLPGQDR
ncbi:hypothetical protein O0881_00145 [Janthinobacterium sp. SUN100]|uniref:hypothetical protein n=1 Tax=Janthinobacterium sp. SUN100 TaxID=3004101 RepID=UPI0025B1384B|nr:hypothetical protein [Janthinobacterium sp. SUN100]MDN2700399.1 hypothetical protein [Janthinobacterium sp. SUN100]